MKSKRDFADIRMSEGCLNCGQVWGAHSGYNCPGRKSEFFGEKDQVISTPLAIQGDSIQNIPRIGPRKPIPVIPPEIHSTRDFDPVAAWEAVKALSKGS